VLSVSVLPVQPFLDVPYMSCGGLVVANGDVALAERLARSFADEFWAQRRAL